MCRHVLQTGMVKDSLSEEGTCKRKAEREAWEGLEE